MPKRLVGWHREDIKAAVRKRGVSLEELSLSNGLEKRACASSLCRPHFAAELVIAEFLGVSPRQIWPQRFLPDGTYRHLKSLNHHTRHGGARECQNGAAA